MWWAVVQLDFDEKYEPWSVMYGTMPVQHHVQRTIQSMELWALYVALCHLAEADVLIHTHKFGVEQALAK